MLVKEGLSPKTMHELRGIYWVREQVDNHVDVKLLCFSWGSCCLACGWPHGCPLVNMDNHIVGQKVLDFRTQNIHRESHNHICVCVCMIYIKNVGWGNYGHRQNKIMYCHLYLAIACKSNQNCIFSFIYLAISCDLHGKPSGGRSL